MDNNVSNSITNRQMFFGIFMTLTTFSSTSIPGTMAREIGRSSWIPLLAMSVIAGIAAVIITKLNNSFQGKVLFDYGREVVGKLFSYMITGYYLLYFFIMCTYFEFSLVAGLKVEFLPKTPVFVLLLTCIIMVAFVAFKGVTNVARLYEFTGVIFIIVMVLLCFLMIIQGNKYNVLPLFIKSEVRNYLPGIKSLIVPFGGFEVMFLIPFTRNNRKAPVVAFITLMLVGLLYVLIVESTIMILGINNTMSTTDALIEGIRIIEVPAIDRVDIINMTVLLMGTFSGIIITFIGVLELTCRIFKKCKRIFITVIIGIALLSSGLVVREVANFTEIMKRISPVLVLIATFLLPSILFFVLKVRRAGSKKNKAATKGGCDE